MSYLVLRAASGQAEKGEDRLPPMGQGADGAGRHAARQCMGRLAAESGGSEEPFAQGKVVDLETGITCAHLIGGPARVPRTQPVEHAAEALTVRLAERLEANPRLQKARGLNLGKTPVRHEPGRGPHDALSALGRERDIAKGLHIDTDAPRSAEPDERPPMPVRKTEVSLEIRKPQLPRRRAAVGNAAPAGAEHAFDQKPQGDVGKPPLRAHRGIAGGSETRTVLGTEAGRVVLDGVQRGCRGFEIDKPQLDGSRRDDRWLGVSRLDVRLLVRKRTASRLAPE